MNSILGVTYPALETYFSERGENKAKAKIVYNSIYKSRVTGFGQIEGLSSRIKNILEADFVFGFPEVLDKRDGSGAAKLLFKLDDSNTVESVLMRHDYGNALCVSTQVGCNMGCAFCLSGVTKKIRDLLPYEMVSQVLLAERVLGEKIRGVTLMGIGEPLDNYENAVDFISVIGHQQGKDVAPRRITVSTCGLVSQIKRLMEEKINCNLAVSLHAPDDETRSRLMPINKVYSVNELIGAIRGYSADRERSNKKITLEYIMLDGINDSDEHARRLAELIQGIKCYVNLIPYNETGLNFKRSEADRIKNFYSVLIQSGVRATVRREFGGEIKAACGQLCCLRTARNEHKE